MTASISPTSSQNIILSLYEQDYLHFFNFFDYINTGINDLGHKLCLFFKKQFHNH